MQKFIAWLENWLWRSEQQRVDRALRRHFTMVHPESVTDIDKYLRAQGLAP